MKFQIPTLTKIILHNAIANTGTEKKNRWGRIAVFSIKKKSKKLKFNLIRVSAHNENLAESVDMENPELKW